MLEILSYLNERRVLSTFPTDFWRRLFGALRTSSRSRGLAVGPAVTSSWEEPPLPHSLTVAVGQGSLGSRIHQKITFIFISFHSEAKRLAFLDFYEKLFSAFLQITLLT